MDTASTSMARESLLEVVPLSAHRNDVRNVGLDIARAAAIIMVLASHTLTEFLPKPLAIAVTWGGKAGVELFFSLSGFLIGTLLIRMSERPFGPADVGRFLVRRWMRTLPAYYAALIFVSWFFGSYNLHPFLLMQNFYQGEPQFLVVGWSLVLEEYFYFFFPLTMLVAQGLFGRGATLVLWVAAGLIVVCLVGRVCAAVGVVAVSDVVLHENPFLRMDCAAYGVVCACLLRLSAPFAEWVGRHRRMVVAAGLTVFLVQAGAYVAILSLPAEWLLRVGFFTWGKAYLTLSWTILDAGFAVLVLGLFVVRPVVPWPVLGAIRVVSLWSYSIYLVHTVMMAIIPYYLPTYAHGLPNLVLVLGGTFAVSFLSFVCIERPGVVLRDWLTAPRGRAVAPAGRYG